MFFSTFSLLPALLALFGAGQPSTGVSRMVAEEQLTMRVRIVSTRPRIPVQWVEKKGPRCIASREVIAATLTGDQSIDFHLRNRRRVRAELDSDCPTLDFYGSFYLQPEDERICAGRDEIRPRIGGSCQIERFHLMVPRPAR